MGGDDHDSPDPMIAAQQCELAARADGLANAAPAPPEVASEPGAGAAHSRAAVAGGDCRGADPSDQSHGGDAQTH